MMMCLTIAGISTSCSGRNAVAKTDSELRSLVRDFNRKDGFNVVYVNGLLTAIARSAAGVAMFSEDMDPEARTALKACRDVKGLIVVDYEEASSADASAFRDGLDRFLKPEHLLLECMDEEDNVKIWASGISDKGVVNGIVIDVDGEALIYVKGSVDVNELSSLMAD